MSDLIKPKSTHTGKLFGHVDCHVLDDKRRVVTHNGIIRGLTDGAVDRGDLGRYVSKLPNGSRILALRPEIEFDLPGGAVHRGHVPGIR